MYNNKISIWKIIPKGGGMLHQLLCGVGDMISGKGPVQFRDIHKRVIPDHISKFFILVDSEITSRFWDLLQTKQN